MKDYNKGKNDKLENWKILERRKNWELGKIRNGRMEYFKIINDKKGNGKMEIKKVEL